MEAASFLIIGNSIAIYTVAEPFQVVQTHQCAYLSANTSSYSSANSLHTTVETSGVLRNLGNPSWIHLLRNS